MTDWDWDGPVFGAPPEAGAWIIRPSAYGLIMDDNKRLAVVLTRQGVFLLACP
jgi:hypothetical protein